MPDIRHTHDFAQNAPFDFRYAPQLATDPWRYFGGASDGPEIFWSDALGGHWVVARAALIDEVYRRYDLFSNGAVSIPKPPRPQSIPASLDPPEHGKYRKIISQNMFSPRALATLDQDVATLSQGLLDRIAGRGACDFIADFARPLPVALLLRMLGLPDGIVADLTKWVRMMFHGSSNEEHVEGYQAAFAYLGRWLDDRLEGREEATGTVLPAMLDARVDGRALTRDEMHGMAMLLVGAGVDTVTSQMGHMMHHFARHPLDRQYLSDHPEAIPQAIEELLRRYGIANIARVVRNDMRYHGADMRAGQMVLCASAIAGLDPSAFADPMAVDFGRPDVKAKHHPFGAGPHVCPGAHLARTVLRDMVGRVLPRLPGLRVAATEPLGYVSGITVALTRLPLEWDVPPASE